MTALGRIPRILYLTAFSPYGPQIGARVRSEAVLRALRQIGDVEQIVLGSAESDNAVTSAPPANPSSFTVEVVELPHKSILRKLQWLLDPNYPFPNRFRVDDDGIQCVQSYASSFDLVWFFKLHAADSFPPQLRFPRAVVDVDDIPSTLENTRLRSSNSVSERVQALRNRFTWRRRERLLGQRFNVLSVCSEEDRHYLQQLGVNLPIHIIRNGFDEPAEEPVRSRSMPPRIGFLGFLDFPPNSQGLHWFVDRCWPRVKRAIPDVRLRIVGKGSESFASAGTSDVDCLGWIPNADDELRTWATMIVPIHTGAGTRVKIAHSFSQKCPLISTSFGAFGYGAENGRNMLIADAPEDFADACIRLIRNPEDADHMAELAWNEFLTNWSWESIRPAVSATVEECLRTEPSQGEVHG